MIQEAPLVRIQNWTRTRLKRYAGLWQSAPMRPLRAIWSALTWVARQWHTRVWLRYAVNAEGNYTPRRVWGTILGSLFALWLIPSLFLAGWQIGLITFTYKDEVLFLTSAEEVDPEAEIHSVRGCRQIPCSEADAVYFRVRGTILHDIWSLSNRGGMFYPEEVAGIIAPGVNRCEVKSYGIRVRALMRGWGIYPDMLDAICVPYNEASASAAAANAPLSAMPVQTAAEPVQ